MNLITLLSFIIIIQCYVYSCKEVCHDRAGLEGLTSKDIYIGDTKVKVMSYYNPIGEFSNLSFLNLHENENTSVVAARSLAHLKGGRVIWIDHGGERLISFKLKNVTYRFDPNRIYTKLGIELTLKQYGPYSKEAANEVEKFVEFIINYYDLYKKNPAIAIHNNSPSYSAIDYLPGHIYEKEALDVYICKDSEPRNFFMVTDKRHHLLLKENGYNSVLQTGPQNLTDDGSLSVYCAFNNIKYINVEAAAYHNGNGERIINQLGMLNGLGKLLNKYKQDY